MSRSKKASPNAPLRKAPLLKAPLRKTAVRKTAVRKAKQSGAAARRKSAAPHSYHHGDLRQALLDATEAVLLEKGVDGLTLRECARRAGVSHGAPAHHFGDVRGLLTAFSTISYALLDARMRAERSAANPAPMDQLIATGIAYVEFALAHPARFRLMFRHERLTSTPSLLETGARSYTHLRECIEQIDAGEGGDGTLLNEKTALAWTLVHGFATLLLDSQGFTLLVPPGKAAVRGFLDRVLHLSSPGYRASAWPE